MNSFEMFCDSPQSHKSTYAKYLTQKKYKLLLKNELSPENLTFYCCCSNARIYFIHKFWYIAHCNRVFLQARHPCNSRDTTRFGIGTDWPRSWIYFLLTICSSLLLVIEANKPFRSPCRNEEQADAHLRSNEQLAGWDHS